ncbi:MAG: lipid A deacylase LpxR family protein [Planctomycetota bacterium]
MIDRPGLVAACVSAFAGTCCASAFAQDGGETDGTPSGLLTDGARHDQEEGLRLDDPALRFNLLTLEWENDAISHTLFGPDIDRRYSNGLAIELSLTPSDGFYDAYLEPLDFFNEFDDPRSAVGGMVRHYIFTPEDIEITTPQPDDHPFTGLLSFAAFFQRAQGRTFDHLQLDVGYIGQNSGAQAVQEFVHSVLPDQGDPSWVNQQASGLGVFATAQRRWKLRWQNDPEGNLGLLTGDELDAMPISNGPGFEIIPYAGFRAGNVYTDANAGAIFRWGWPLPNDFGQSRIFDFTDHTRQANDGFGFSLYASAGARAVARNAFIEGNILGGNRRLDTKELVGEFQAGVQFEYHGCLFGYSQSIITEEYDGQQGVTRFGTFSFTFNLAH